MQNRADAYEKVDSNELLVNRSSCYCLLLDECSCPEDLQVSLARVTFLFPR